MKCGIVTVYKSQNGGSFLQAFALQTAIQKMGINASFVDYVPNTSSRNTTMAKALIKGDFKTCRRMIIQQKLFNNAITKYLNITKCLNDIDVLVLGSDTIWDLSIDYFAKNKELFWGRKFENRIISYAPSIGKAEECVFTNAWVKESLSRIQTVSVRDEDAKKYLEPIANKKISVVCDPTFLLSKEEFLELKQVVTYGPCIFLYYYGKLDEAYVNEIRLIAKRKHLKIVTFGNSNKWCDYVLPYSPELFITLYNDAKYIITNTFHGTVFAHIFNKNFCVLGNNKRKVNDLLSHFQTVCRMATVPNQIAAILKKEYDYKVVNEIIDADRKIGLEYLTNALTEGCE